MGSGKQYFPWIHIDDLCRFILHSLNDAQIEGPYNLAATEHVNNRQFMKTLGKTLHRPVFLPAVPSFLLRIFLGEMANIILEGSRVSNKKVTSTGFRFIYEELSPALNQILS
jgi:NAD dependent epimerase/dehydratase family enzyme